MKQIYTLTFFCISLLFFGQNLTDQIKYELPGTGYIWLPSAFEVQDGTYKALAHKVQELAGNEVTEDRIVFQMNGKNKSYLDRKPSYEKLIFETHIGNAGDFEKIDSNNLPTYTDLKEVGDLYKSDLEYASPGIKIKLLVWYGAKNVKIGTLNAVKISYIRQIGANEPCRVDLYKIQNNDRVHTLTVVYRQSGRTQWSPIFNKIINSLNITEVR